VEGFVIIDAGLEIAPMGRGDLGFGLGLEVHDAEDVLHAGVAGRGALGEEGAGGEEAQELAAAVGLIHARESITR
jgi:hypothetical protein